MSFLGHVLHTFSHILGDVLPHFGPLEQQFGMTPGSGGTIANLIMQSEAGDPQAAEMLAQYQDPNQLEFIEHARGWLHGHPHYNTFLAHAGHPYGMAGRPSPFLRSGPVPHYAERHFARTGCAPTAQTASGLTVHPHWAQWTGAEQAGWGPRPGWGGRPGWHGPGFGPRGVRREERHIAHMEAEQAALAAQQGVPAPAAPFYAAPPPPPPWQGAPPPPPPWQQGPLPSVPAFNFQGGQGFQAGAGADRHHHHHYDGAPPEMVTAGRYGGIGGRNFGRFGYGGPHGLGVPFGEYGVPWGPYYYGGGPEEILTEQESLDEIPAYYPDEPEHWRTARHPHGPRGI